MTLELFNTSVPSGLEPGRSGFCTVTMTRGIPRPLIELLETLSAYRPLFLPGDPQSANNPVAVSHLRISLGGKVYALLSRIGASGLDYTNRSNRFAHHVVLEAGDPRPVGGPAWLAARPGFLQAAWDGQVRWLEAGRVVPGGDGRAGGCHTWKRLTGDPGWAGVLAEAMVGDAGRPVYLICEPGTDPLPLIAEALGVLPPERRWAVTFTTYFTGLPAGIQCQVRAVLRGTPEAETALAGTTLDLARLAGQQPPATPWVQAARAGRSVSIATPQRKVRREERGSEEKVDGRRGAAQSPLVTPHSSPAELSEPPPLPEFELVPYEPRSSRRSRRSGSGLLVGIALGLLLTVGVGIATVFAVNYLGSTRPPDNGDAIQTHHSQSNEQDGKEGPDEPDRGKKSTEPAVTPRTGNDRVDPGELLLKLDTAAPRYGEPIVLTAGVKERAGSVSDRRAVLFKELAGRLQFALDGKRLPQEEVRVMEDGKVYLASRVEAGEGHRLQMEFAGDERFRPAGPITVVFKVRRSRLGPFRARVLKAPGGAGEQVQLLLSWPEVLKSRSPRFMGPLDLSERLPEGLDETSLSRFRFLLLPSEGAATDLQVRPFVERPGLFTLLSPLVPGRNRIRVRYPEDGRFEETSSQEDLDIEVKGYETSLPVELPMDRFFTPGGQLPIEVKSLNPDLTKVPVGRVVALLDGKRAALPAPLHEGKAVLSFDIKDIPIILGRRKLTLRYEPSPGALHQLYQRSYQVHLIEERIFHQFRTTPKAGEKDACIFERNEGKLPLKLPAGLRYGLRLVAPDRKDTGNHTFTASPVLGPRLEMRWGYRAQGQRPFGHQLATFTLTALKEDAPAKDKEQSWELAFKLHDFKRPEHTDQVVALVEACQKPELVRACWIELVDLDRFGPKKSPEEYLLLRIRLGKP